jgi:tripartite-type tricarboxylate transporter receptor subunit TctC
MRMAVLVNSRYMPEVTMAGGTLLRAGAAATAALLALSFVAAAPAAAETWPTRPIKLINALAAGSAPDILSRMIAEPLSRALGQQVVVENRAGAANILATQAAARAAPDGYTLYFGPSLALAVNPHTFKSLPYDPVTDFTYVAMVSKAAFFVLAHPDLPANTLPELIALDKAKPGQLSVAVDGPKNSSGMLAAWLNKTAGLSMVLVPYATMPQGIQDTLAGRVQLTVAAGLIAAPHIDRGALRPLAVSSANRIPGYPNVPTIAETFPGFEFVGWFVLAAPRGTPADVVRRLNQAMDQILRDPELVRRLGELGFYVDGALTPAATAAFVRSQRDAWGEIVRAAGITPE